MSELRLLLVDDNETNLDLLSRRLERKGCVTVSVTDGKAALEKLGLEKPRLHHGSPAQGSPHHDGQGGFDAVVLDLRMPGMTGLEVLAEIRRKRTQVELPVIMATAQTDPDDQVAALEAGANDYVTKPIDVNVLFARIRAQVRSRAVAAPQPPTRRSSAMSLAAVSLGLGTVIHGRYRLEEMLGSGGFGAVFRARHEKLDSDVAIKILHPHLASTAAVRKRFEQEAISACRVKHHHAVQVLDAASSELGIPYIVMELLSGPTLSEELVTVTRFSLGRATEILVPVCEVLEEAHRVGIVHRDVKPANIMLSHSPRGEVVKVLDFGIATFVNREQQLGLTGEGTVGTPLFMSPEALLGRATSPASDVFSTGVTAYVMLAGEAPHGPPAESPFEQAIRQVHHAPVPLASVRPDLPPEVSRVIMATLSRDPDHRPPMAELLSLIHI